MDVAVHASVAVKASVVVAASVSLCTSVVCQERGRRGGATEPVRQGCERHGEPSAIEANPSWRLLVAPAKGTFSRAGADEGALLTPTEEVGTIASLRDRMPVVAPYGGTIVEWLVEDGDPVSPGQPLVRIHPEGVPA